MAWGTNVNSVTFSYEKNLDKQYDSFKSAANADLVKDENLRKKYKGSDFIGINGKKVVYMRDGIRQYVKDIQAHLDKVIASTNPNVAFHGDYADSVKQYMISVKETCMEFTSGLLEFSDKLDRIAQLYQSKDKLFAGQINSSSKKVESVAKTYTETNNNVNYS